MSRSRSRNPAELGRTGEKLARAYLRSRGYTIWKQNWRCRRGEIDLVATVNRTLCFVEVKTRRVFDGAAFLPLNAVDGGKRKRLSLLAQTFLDCHSRQIKLRRLLKTRFDVLAIYFDEQGAEARIEHHEGALTAETRR